MFQMEVYNSKMAVETAAIIGLAVLPFLVILVLREFRQAQNMIDEAILTLTILFIIGLEYAGYGIAQSNTLGNAADAYLVALLITVLVFFGIVIELARKYKNENQEGSLGGFSLSR